MNHKFLQKFLLVSLSTGFIFFALYLSLKTLPFKINELLPTEHPTRLAFEKYDLSFKNELDFNILVHNKNAFETSDISHVLKILHRDLKSFSFIKQMTSFDNGEYLQVKDDYVRLTPFTNFDRKLISSYENIVQKNFLQNLFISKSKKSLLISGQFTDFKDIKTERADMKLLTKRMEELKTAALIRVSVLEAARAAGANLEQLEALEKYSKNLGLAFQVVDDILDQTRTTQELGKTAGKDLIQEKQTYVKKLGLEAARNFANNLITEAKQVLKDKKLFCDKLFTVADYVVLRKN